MTEVVTCSLRREGGPRPCLCIVGAIARGRYCRKKYFVTVYVPNDKMESCLFFHHLVPFLMGPVRLDLALYSKLDRAEVLSGG